MYNLLMTLGLVYNCLMSLGPVCTTLHLSEDFCTLEQGCTCTETYTQILTHSGYTFTMLTHPGICTHMYNAQCSLTLEFLLKCNLLTHPGTSVHKPTVDLQWNFCTHAHHSFSNFCTLVQCSITLKCRTHVQCSLILEFLYTWTILTHPGISKTNN